MAPLFYLVVIDDSEWIRHAPHGTEKMRSNESFHHIMRRLRQRQRHTFGSFHVSSGTCASQPPPITRHTSQMNSTG
jgi:hypothetical protein